MQDLKPPFAKLAQFDKKHNKAACERQHNMKEGINMAKKKMSTKKEHTPFTEMLVELKQSIDPRTNERLAEAMDVSPRMISKYLNKGAIPSYYTVCNLITELRLHPIDAIRLAKAAGYDITVDTEDNRYLWDKLTAKPVCRFGEEITAKKRK